MKHISIAISTVLLFGEAIALRSQQVPVTFRVNMSIQRAIGAFDPTRGDTVLVAGNWDGWSTTNQMTQSENPDIYTLTLSLPVGSWPNYKFVINPYGSSSGSDLIWENLGPNVNRWFQVPPGGTNLPVVYFGDASNAVVTADITFQVDMSAQIALGNFNPETDLVFVAGDWNWNATGSPPLTRSETNTNVWITTIRLTNVIGRIIDYKFLYVPYSGNTVWESDGVGPNGARNRQFAFPATNTNLPVVFFNNLSNVTAVVVKPVTFVLNLATLTAYGNFEPGYDYVTVAGEFNGWSAFGWELTQSPTNPYVYVGTFNITNIPGTPIAYKFTINGGITWERDGVGPNGERNRILEMPSEPTVLPMVFFNNLDNLGTVTITHAGEGYIILSWGYGPRIRLQAATNVLGPWEDVPDTLGMDSVTLPMDGIRFFRLAGP